MAERVQGSMRTGIRKALSGAALLALGLGLLAGADIVSSPVAHAVADGLPTWNDVQNAKRNQAAAATKITEIEGLIVQVTAEVEATRKESEAAAAKLVEAENQLMVAEQRLAALEEQAAASEIEASAAAEQAAALVSQLYRSGGVDRTMDLFLESDGGTAEALLDRLASIEKATELNTSISVKAEQAMNSAKSLGDQAEAARDVRDQLRAEAESAAKAAAEAAAAALERLAQQESQKSTLEAQLAALKDTTTATVAGYENRLRLEREEAERIAREGGSYVSSSGWVRPLDCCYWVSTEWWGYYGHRAIDLAIANWTPIRAANSGFVSGSGWIGTYGYAVFIDHGAGVSTRYAHMIQPPSVSLGQWVSAGQVIGYVGSTGNSTGPHLHFETLQGGTQVSPRDFMAARGIWF